MGKRIKLEGTTVGRWKVLYYTGLIKKKAFYLCECECGELSVIRTDKLQEGNPQCIYGCIYNDFSLSGDRYGRLKVNRYSYTIQSKGQSKAYWECECDCDKTCFVTADSLKGGKVRSCGCLLVEFARGRFQELRVPRPKTGKHKPCDNCGDEIYVPRWKQSKFENHYCSPKCRAIHKATVLVGENHHAYIKDRSKLAKRRHSAENTHWRLAVLKRDGYLCQCCYEYGETHVHHLKSFARFPELRFDVDNGVTMCEPCHKEFHRVYGIKRFTSDDYYEFKKNKEGGLCMTQ